MEQPTILKIPKMTDDEQKKFIEDWNRIKTEQGQQPIEVLSLAPEDALSILETSLSVERIAQIDAIVSGNTPMERWERHTGVTTFAHLMEWADMQLREAVTMRTYRDIANGGMPKDDELGDYLVGKSAALTMALANMRQIMEYSCAKDNEIKQLREVVWLYIDATDVHPDHQNVVNRCAPHDA